MAEIRSAIYWWLCENCEGDQEARAQIRGLLEHFFYCASSLHDVLKNHPLPTVGGDVERVEISVIGKCDVCIVNRLFVEDFFRLRGMLALVGDMVCVIEQVRRLSKRLDNSTLSDLLESHLPNMRRYRYARNFFAHFDERIGKGREKHGVSGKLEIPELDISYAEDAEGCFYLGFAGDTLYYHDRQRGEVKASPKSVSFNKEAMADIFSLVTDLYDLVTSHSIRAGSYAPSKRVYDLS